VRARSAADSGWADCSVIIIENPREIPVRASFRTVRRHECDIDDPLFAEQYFPKFPSVNDATMEISLTKPGETFICVSLTGSYHGHHYKIAAAFFEPQK
jgi:hypothetical protein